MSTKENGIVKTSPSSKTIEVTPGFRSQIVWFNVAGYVVLHMGMIYGYYLLFTQQVKFITFLWGVLVGYIGMLGITIGAHRLFSHKAFKASQPLRILLVLAFVIAGQNSLWEWVRDHRVHHKYSDTDADPHNASRGFFFCHTGWLLMKKLPLVIEKSREVDMTDLNADPWVMFQKKYFGVLYVLIGLLIPVIVPVFLWNESFWNSFWLCYFSRYVTSLHVTWCVNSVAHYFGSKPYTKEMLPVETGWVSFLTAGEGWHNFHHTFPWDYRASEYGKLNFTTSVIDLLAKVGWITDMRYVSDEVIAYRITKQGDGSHPLTESNVTDRPDFEFDYSDMFGKKLEKYIYTSNKNQ